MSVISETGAVPWIYSKPATTLLMVSSAGLMAAAGLVLSFAPHEVAGLFGMTSSAPLALLLQMSGALYLGAAMANWMGRFGIIGGIFGRPIALGNLTHFVIGALALLKSAGASTQPGWLWLAAGLYAVFALVFCLLVFFHPGMQRGT